MMRKFLCVAVLAGTLTFAFAAETEERIATQGGTTVTLGDVDGFMQRIPADRRAGFLENSTRIDQMTINLLRDKQLAKQAIDLKLDQDPEVKARIAFETQQVLAAKRLEVFESTLKIPSFTLAAKEEYTAHKKDYMASSDVEVQHVLINNSDRLDIEARALADKVREEAVANPAKFDQLVEKYSDDPSKKENKGHLHDATSAKYVAPFVAAVKTLERENQISQVVPTQFGYHIVKLIKNHPARQMEFAEVKDKIEAKLKDNYIAEQRRALLSKLDDGKPTVNPNIVEILRTRYVPKGVMTPTDAAKQSSQ